MNLGSKWLLFGYFSRIVQNTHFLLLSLSLLLIHTLTYTWLLSDDEDASVASRRAALYSANTVAQIASKKDTEPDRMEIDNSFGKLYRTTLHLYMEEDSTCSSQSLNRMHDDLLPDYFLMTTITISLSSFSVWCPVYFWMASPELS